MVRRVRMLLEALPPGIDGLLVTKLVNVRYLTGFTGSNGAVLVSRASEPLLATDGRYAEQAAGEAPDVRVVVTRMLVPELLKAARSSGLHTVGIERHHVTLSAYDAMLAAADGLELYGSGELVEALRTTKDEGELAALREAGAITDLAFADVCRRLRPAVTEREVAWWLLEIMRAQGADDAAFDSIVAFGPHSAIPHHRPTDRPLARGELVKLDFGAQVRGYHADMTRTVVCGSAQPWQRELHDVVAEVQLQLSEAAVVGAVPVELDRRAQQLLSAAGHSSAHGLGHGVGLEIHEKPFLVPGSADPPLRVGMPVTIEPGVYLPGLGGVRIEDSIVVTANGAEALTNSPRELAEV